MTVTALTDPLLLDDVAALRERLDGDVVTPRDPGWDDARAAWNLAVDQRPLAVVFAASAEDVVEVVDHARIRGITVAPQGTGHFAPARGSVEGSILLRTDRMRAVSIDPETGVARAEAGVLWQEVADAAAEHGLAALAGSSADVGVVGYTLGGGMGWMARRYGLAANSVVAVELVTPDGRHVRADAENEADLFWAVRGGGGSFGVVTALEFRLYPVSEIYAGVMFWPVERAAEILGAWREWVDTVPDEVTSLGRLMHFPPLPDFPEHLRGRSFAIVETAILGSEVEAARLLQPLRDLDPEMDTVATIPASRLSEVHMDPPHPVPGAGDGGFLADFTPDAIQALVDVAGGGSETPLLSIEVRHLGGMLAEPSPEHGAVGTIDAGFAFFSVGAAMTPEMGAAVGAAAGGVQTALAPWLAGRTYFNFTERRTGGGDLYGAETHRRLREIKAQVDPQELLRVAHPISPAA